MESARQCPFEVRHQGTPLIMISPLPMEFRREGDKIVMRLEEYDSVRTIHMNLKESAPSAHTLYGYSRGNGKVPRWWSRPIALRPAGLDHLGAPQSDQIKTVERFRKRGIQPSRLHANNDRSRELHEPSN